MDLLGFGGSLVSAGASLFGSKMTADANNKAARLNAIHQATQNQIDRDINQARWLEQLRQADIDRNLQKEFAQSGVSWRVQDARNAGIHPLAALGFQGPSSTPISVSGPTESSNPQSPFAGASMGSGISAAGQDISRAIQALSPEAERLRQYNETAQALNLQKAGLENVLLASQIRRTSTGVGPAMPTATGVRQLDGQGNSPPRGGQVVKNGLVQSEPNKVTATAKGRPEAEVGSNPWVGFIDTPTGKMPVPGEKAKERIEDNWVYETVHAVRNLLTPFIGGGTKPPPVAGHYWKWSPMLEWQMKKRGPNMLQKIEADRARRSGVYERARNLQNYQTRSPY